MPIYRYAAGKKIIFVAGMMADKDISGIFDCLKELDNKNFEIYTCTVHSNPRSAGGEYLAELATKKGFGAKAFSDVNSACINAQGKCDLLVIFGSLYMYKECTVYQGEKEP